MNKKKFAEHVDLLVAKNNELYNDNVALSRELDKKNETIKELENQIAELEAAISNFNKNDDSVVKFNVLTEEDLVNLANDDEFTEPDVTHDNVIDDREDDLAEEQIQNEIPISQETTQKSVGNIIEPAPIDVEPKIADASAVIGKAVLKCAELCNLFTQQGGPNAKDLVNLALGRTEVFKSEILGLVSDYSDFNDAAAEVNSKLASLEEYFELLKKQI